MKSISAPAMAAIEAGEAIVTGAVEFYTPGLGPVGIPEASDVILTWQQSGDPFFLPDTGTMSLAYYDEAGDLIGSEVLAPSVNAAAGVWTLRTLTDSTPAGAVRLRVRIRVGRNAGVDATQAFDNIALTIGGTDVPITNPGAEVNGIEIENPTGWTAEVGSIYALASHSSVPGLVAYDGTYFFYGGTNNIISAYQDIYLSEIAPPEPGVVEAVLRVWGGYGPIEIDGATYQGIGDRGLAQQTANAIGGFAQGLTIGVSRVEPAALTLLDADEIKGGSVILRRLIFASDGKTLLDYDIWDRGRVDTVETVETIGREAAIKVAVESAARGLGSAGARMRSDSDQRLINPNDGYFRKTSYAGEKSLYWGGRKPERPTGTAFGGNTGGIGGPFSG